jgi:rubrerythrin
MTMKKHFLLSALVILFGAIVLDSCGNAEAEGSNMQEPTQVNGSKSTEKNESESSEENEENEENEEKGKKGNSVVNSSEKTIEDLQAAFKGETTASAKYEAYSKKAEKEGFHEIAILFKAASAAENIHANNHKAVLTESGVNAPVITPEFTVKSTKENLEDAIKGESYEASTMYPEFLKDAKSAGNQLALISLNYAFETEKKHKVMYENALAALENNAVKTLSSVFYVCPTCGNTYNTAPPKRCGISMTSSEKFIKITTL